MVLFCDVCRTMGVAARFVSGYECASASGKDPYMHAWAEVYLAGVGWRGYDSARGLAVSNRHVAVAAAFDSDLASPVGGWYSGESGMETSVRMQVDAAGWRIAVHSSSRATPPR
jgi:transglutaminase-like putative cysteine protease